MIPLESVPRLQRPLPTIKDETTARARLTADPDNASVPRARSLDAQEAAMNGLMQERPLNIPMIVRHAERLLPHETVTTKTADGVRVATFAELLTRARR